MKPLLPMDKMSLSLEFNTLHTHNSLQYQIDSSNVYTKTYFVILNCYRETPSLPSSHTKSKICCRPFNKMQGRAVANSAKLHNCQSLKKGNNHIKLKQL